MGEVKKREVIRKIYIESSIIWFVQAMLEDSHLVALSLGDKNPSGKNSISIFYDAEAEKDVIGYIDLIRKFIVFEFGEKYFIILQGET
jgi:hypothetical protein